MANVKITLTRGLPGTTQRQRATVESLGLRRVSHSVVKPDSPELRGQIDKVRHLVTVEEA
jgi:large subunit ribosomal protein L30